MSMDSAHAYDLWLANRRDSLLLLLLQSTILLWGWEQGSWGALGSSLATAALFILLLLLARQTRGWLRENQGLLLWTLVLLTLGTLPTTLLLARAAWQGLGSGSLMALLALLALAWQLWLSFWAVDPSTQAQEEEDDGRME